MDFEEFLWAKGYSEEFIDGLYQNMLEVKPINNLQMDVLFGLFRDYATIGGMPEVVDLFWEVTKIVYFIGNEHMLIAHDSNRLRFS